MLLVFSKIETVIIKRLKPNILILHFEIEIWEIETLNSLSHSCRNFRTCRYVRRDIFVYVRRDLSQYTKAPNSSALIIHYESYTFEHLLRSQISEIIHHSYNDSRKTAKRNEIYMTKHSNVHTTNNAWRWRFQNYVTYNSKVGSIIFKILL